MSKYYLAVLFTSSLLFSNGSLADCSPRTFSNDENNVIKAYVAYYGRFPDSAGLQWWANQLSENDGDLGQIIEAFGTSEEFERNFGNLSSEQLINNLYQQAFGRNADPDGLAYYADALENGSQTLQSIALGIFSGAINEDADIINNRMRSAQHYATLAGYSGVEFSETELQSQVKQITQDSTTANDSCDSISASFSAQNAEFTATSSLACDYQSNPVAWQALMDTDAPNLSDYNLFSSAADPTQNPNCGGMPYDLATPLFTDYASKYRFVFVPEGKQIKYNPNEALEFPIGTVLTKTFAIPANTDYRGENEERIETRLLIHRESGWHAIPYIWNESKTDATLARAGGLIQVSLVHNGETKSFTYAVPDQNKCKQCHQYKAEGASTSDISPIGPKARHLNHEFNYSQGVDNQLYHWADVGVLTDIPINPGEIDAVVTFEDADAETLTERSDDTIMQLAKGYLDINCAHCHRPEGNASNTGLHLEYWRTYAENKSKHGVCKKPVAYGGGALEYDVIPGNAENSILHFRMSSDTPGDRMPEIGRSLIHEEGVALISEWINRLGAESCSQ